MGLGVRDQGEDRGGPGGVVHEDCRARGLNREDAMDRCGWREMVKEAG